MDMLEHLAAQEARAIIREVLQDEVAQVPPNVDLIRTDRFCEEWSVATQIGAIPLVFYYTGIVVVNTAPYDAVTLAWITAKARLMEVTHDERIAA